MKLFSTTLSTPVGPFTLLGDDQGIRASGFTDDALDLRLPLGGANPRLIIEPLKDLGVFSRAVAAYFAGDLAAIDEVPVLQPGTAYYQAAWAALRAIPPGMPISYRDLAERLGNAAATRAAGTACGRNAAALFVPCHRVVRSDGGLGGFAWGLACKRWLLAHEAAALAPASLARNPIEAAGAAAR